MITVRSLTCHATRLPSREVLTRISDLEAERGWRRRRHVPVAPVADVARICFGCATFPPDPGNGCRRCGGSGIDPNL